MSVHRGRSAPEAALPVHGCARPVKQVPIDLVAPGFVDPDRLILRRDDVSSKYIAALCIPHMRMERVVHEDVVLDHAPIPLAVLDTAVQAKIVVDVVVARTIIEIDIPAMIAAPAAVADGDRLDAVQRRQLWMSGHEVRRPP